MRTLTLVLSLGAVAGLTWTQPAVADGGVLNGASFTKGQAVAPGSLVSIFGTGLASALLQGDTVPLSNSLGSTSVTFNGSPAGLYFVSSGQINAQVPWEMPAGSVNMVVTGPGGKSATFPVTVAAAAPGIFSIPPGAGYAIAINADGSLAAPAGAIAGTATHPANAGDTLVVLATGLGAVDIPVADGAASLDALRHTVTVPVVLIGGQKAQVPFSGLTPQFPGVNQVNVVVPTVSAGASVPIQLQAGGIITSSSVVIAIGS